MCEKSIAENGEGYVRRVVSADRGEICRAVIDAAPSSTFHF
jgi:hypothetical protein